MLHFPCNKCSVRLKAAESRGGGRLRCPSCRQVVSIPNRRDFARSCNTAGVLPTVCLSLSPPVAPLSQQPSADDIVRLRQLVSEWASSIPHHSAKAFGEKIKITAADELLIYQLDLVSQVQTREVFAKRRPWHRGERFPARKAPLGDVWSYAVPDCEEFDGVEWHLTIPGTSEIVPCNSCGAAGSHTCQTCAGRRRTACPQCRGKGKIIEEKTKTTGVVFIGGIPIPRSRKIRSAKICPRCAGKRRLVCTACGGRGTFKCDPCAASGKQVESTHVKVTFTPSEGSRRFGHPDLVDVQLAGEELSEYWAATTPTLSQASLDESKLGSIEHHLRQLVSEADGRCVVSGRVVLQRIRLWRSIVARMSYEYRGMGYRLIAVRNSGRVITEHSPFTLLERDAARVALGWLDHGDIEKGLGILDKCVEMRAAPGVTEQIVLTVRRKLSDALLTMGEKKWDGCSLSAAYYSACARCLDSSNPAVPQLASRIVTLGNWYQIGAVGIGAAAGGIVAVFRPLVGIAIATAVAVILVSIIRTSLRSQRLRAQRLRIMTSLSGVWQQLGNDRETIKAELLELRPFASQTPKNCGGARKVQQSDSARRSSG
jgi:hypothetical protein